MSRRLKRDLTEENFAQHYRRLQADRAIAALPLDIKVNHKQWRQIAQLPAAIGELMVPRNPDDSFQNTQNLNQGNLFRRNNIFVKHGASRHINDDTFFAALNEAVSQITFGDKRFDELTRIVKTDRHGNDYSFAELKIGGNTTFDIGTVKIHEIHFTIHFDVNVQGNYGAFHISCEFKNDDGSTRKFYVRFIPYVVDCKLKFTWKIITNGVYDHAIGGLPNPDTLREDERNFLAEISKTVVRRLELNQAYLFKADDRYGCGALGSQADLTTYNTESAFLSIPLITDDKRRPIEIVEALVTQIRTNLDKAYLTQDAFDTSINARITEVHRNASVAHGAPDSIKQERILTHLKGARRDIMAARNFLQTQFNTKYGALLSALPSGHTAASNLIIYNFYFNYASFDELSTLKDFLQKLDGLLTLLDKCLANIGDLENLSVRTFCIFNKKYKTSLLENGFKGFINDFGKRDAKLEDCDGELFDSDVVNRTEIDDGYVESIVAAGILAQKEAEAPAAAAPAAAPAAAAAPRTPAAAPATRTPTGKPAAPTSGSGTSGRGGAGTSPAAGAAAAGAATGGSGTMVLVEGKPGTYAFRKMNSPDKRSQIPQIWDSSGGSGRGEWRTVTVIPKSDPTMYRIVVASSGSSGKGGKGSGKRRIGGARKTRRTTNSRNKTRKTNRRNATRRRAPSRRNATRRAH